MIEAVEFGIRRPFDFGKSTPRKSARSSMMAMTRARLSLKSMSDCSSVNTVVGLMQPTLDKNPRPG